MRSLINFSFWISILFCALISFGFAQAYPQRLNTNHNAKQEDVRHTQTKKKKVITKSKSSKIQDSQIEHARQLEQEEVARRQREQALEVGEEEVLDRPNKTWNLPLKLDPKVKIIRVYDFLNDPAKTKMGTDEALNFEFKYFNHGAITQEQLKKRKGQYFVVSWENRGNVSNYTLRLDYRQAGSREQVRTLEIPFSQVKGSRKGRFFVTGDAYEKWGVVNSWRISLVQKGVIVAQTKSFIW